MKFLQSRPSEIAFFVSSKVLPSPSSPFWAGNIRDSIPPRINGVKEKTLPFLLDCRHAQKPFCSTVHRDPRPDLSLCSLFAAEWLSAAFGFTVRLCIANHRIQMRAGEGRLTIAEGSVVPNHSHITQVRVEDALAHCERARQHGAVILTEPTDHMYGERQYNAQDFHGHKWDFTQTIADVEPEKPGRGFRSTSP